MSEEEFKEMIKGLIADELKVVIEKMQVAKPQQSIKKDFLTRDEVIKEFSICSTTLYELKKKGVLVPKNFANGGRDYYFLKDLYKHFS